MGSPWAWRLSGVIALLALLAGPVIPGATGGRVLAHSQLVTSSPGAGTVLPESPTEIRLVFSEPLETQLTSLDISTADGGLIAARVGLVDPNDPFALVLADPAFDDGVYTVTWRTLSAADGHTAEGVVAFGIGDVGVSVVGSGDGFVHEAAEPTAVIGRWLTYIGLLLAVGLAVFHRVVVRSGPMPRRLIRWIGAALVLSGAATLMAAVASGLEARGVIEYLTGSRNGGLQLARAALATAGGGMLFVVGPRLAGLVSAGAGMAGIVLLVLAGHASAIPGPVATLSQLVHVTGAAVWIGGIVALVLLARRPALLVTGPVPTMRTLVPRFSALALVSIGLVVLTGVHSAIVQTGVVLDIETEYGHTLLMKSGFALGALALGGLNYLDGGRMMTWLDSLRSRVTVELMLATTVLVMTAALASTPPVDAPIGVAIEPVPDAFGSVAPGMTMSIVPGRPGLNRVVVTTNDALSASTLELSLDGLDTGTSTRVALADGAAAGDHGAEHSTATGTTDWVADAVVLPAGSAWNTSVRILASPSGSELSRQRFAFSLSDAGIDQGRQPPGFDGVAMIAAVLLLAGGLGAGLGLGGMNLPRCEPGASRVALVVGGGIAVVLGASIAAGRLLG
ncbi:MAG: copper resistance CopC/CopD family protein [Candidatus Limnocylindria bacterium]